MTSPEGESPSPQGRFVVTPVRSLTTLVAAHPRALQSLFHAGNLAEPSLVGDAPAARLLSIADGTNLFFGLRGAIRVVSSLLASAAWTGKVFDHGGNSGRDVFFGKRLFRFHTEVGPSLFDGQPVLILSYREPGYQNPWPFRSIRNELRMVGPGIAIGPSLIERAGAPTVLFWFGLEATGKAAKAKGAYVTNGAHDPRH
jgi:hypothetical protein